jgi:hypothetical protein
MLSQCSRGSSNREIRYRFSASPRLRENRSSAARVARRPAAEASLSKGVEGTRSAPPDFSALRSQRDTIVIAVAERTRAEAIDQNG